MKACIHGISGSVTPELFNQAIQPGHSKLTKDPCNPVACGSCTPRRRAGPSRQVQYRCSGPQQNSQSKRDLIMQSTRLRRPRHGVAPAPLYEVHQKGILGGLQGAADALPHAQVPGAKVVRAAGAHKNIDTLSSMRVTGRAQGNSAHETALCQCEVSIPGGNHAEPCIIVQMPRRNTL